MTQHGPASQPHFRLEGVFGRAVVATASAIGFVVILGFQLGGERFVIAVDDVGEGVAALIAAAIGCMVFPFDDGSQ